MKTVNVNREALLSALTENRERHIANHKMATEDRRTSVMDTLRKHLLIMDVDVNHQMPETLRFPKTQSHEAEYNRAIAMVEMSVDPTVELTQHEFDQLVLDNWSWQQDFMTNAVLYAGEKVLTREG